MDQASLYNVLKSTGLPVVYRHFTTPPTPPYLAYLFAYSYNFGSDNKVYTKGNYYQVELYTVKKDLASEELIEDALDANEIYWEKTETFIDTENLFQILYEIEI